MKEITLKIPDIQYDFFTELVRQLGIEIAENYEIPAEHIAMVRDRLSTYEPGKMISWADATKQLRFKDNA